MTTLPTKFLLIQACCPWWYRGLPRADQLTLSEPRGWGRLCPPNNTGTLGFSDLPTALTTIYIFFLGLCNKNQQKDQLKGQKMKKLSARQIHGLIESLTIGSIFLTCFLLVLRTSIRTERISKQGKCAYKNKRGLVGMQHEVKLQR